tara:strand:+ start:244 stop:807 length:564 start_codon:yes stop_codon:yes gene_type:complete
VAVGDLTTTALVKTHANISGSDDDTLIGQLVTSVSIAMAAYMDRDIYQTASVERIYRPTPGQSALVLDQWPVASLVVTEDSTALVLDTDYELRNERLLYRISGDVDTDWSSGARISVTSTEGYATIPADLDLAAREQIRFAFQQTNVGGSRLGTASASSPTGDSEGFIPYEWLPFTKAVMEAYRRHY